jgi:hypothetical protein
VLPAALPLLRCASFCAAATPLQGNGDLLFNGVHQQAQEKGYAFVEFRSVEEASNAMALDGVKFRDACLKVSLGWGGCGAGSGSAALEQQTAGLELCCQAVSLGYAGLGKELQRCRAVAASRLLYLLVSSTSPLSHRKFPPALAASRSADRTITTSPLR